MVFKNDGSDHNKSVANLIDYALSKGLAALTYRTRCSKSMIEIHPGLSASMGAPNRFNDRIANLRGSTFLVPSVGIGGINNLMINSDKNRIKYHKASGVIDG
jgi:hypothetical protein